MRKAAKRSKKKTGAKSPPLLNRIDNFQSRADLRRQAIVSAVIDVIAHEGIHELSAFAIGNRTGMRRSHIIYYFPNQEAMVAAAIKYAVSIGQEITVKALAEVSNPRKCLSAYVDATYSWFVLHPEHAPVMALLHYYGITNKEYQALNSQIQEAGESRIFEMLKAGGARGSVTKLRKVSQVMRELLTGSLTSYFCAKRREPITEERNRVRKLILSMADEVW